MFEVWQARKSKLVKDFLAQNTNTTYALNKGTKLTHGSFMMYVFLTLKPKDPTRSVI